MLYEAALLQGDGRVSGGHDVLHSRNQTSNACDFGRVWHPDGIDLTWVGHFTSRSLHLPGRAGRCCAGGRATGVAITGSGSLPRAFGICAKDQCMFVNHDSPSRSSGFAGRWGRADDVVSTAL